MLNLRQYRELRDYSQICKAAANDQYSTWRTFSGVKLSDN